MSKDKSSGSSPETDLRQIRSIVNLALVEDLAEVGDITSSAIFTDGDRAAARIISREACTVSGLATACQEVCRQIDAGLSWLPLVADGAHIPAAAEIARLEGKVLSILAAERTLLNFLSRLSGVATLTGVYVEELKGLPARVSATRKTTPGLRLLEKQAVAHGGGETHRMGLYDAVLIKDNHIEAAGSLALAVAAVRKAYGDEIKIEAEIDRVDQLEEAVASGIDRVLLDNMTPEQVRECSAAMPPGIVIEASGGITIENLRAYAEAGAHIISAGALTSSASGIDFSLEVEAKV